MMINKIFLFIFILGLLYGLVSNRSDLVVNAILTAPKNAFFVFLDIYVLLVFWGGMLEICKESGLLKAINKGVSKVIKPLFKNLDKDDEALQYISMNFVANMLSMGSAATPFGLLAMKKLHQNNNYSPVASDEMITFLLVNTSGLCLIPTTIIALRTQAGSSNPMIVVPYIILVSFLVTSLTIFIDVRVRKYGKR